MNGLKFIFVNNCDERLEQSGNINIGSEMKIKRKKLVPPIIQHTLSPRCLCGLVV